MLAGADTLPPRTIATCNCTAIKELVETREVAIPINVALPGMATLAYAGAPVGSTSTVWNGSAALTASCAGTDPSSEPVKVTTGAATDGSAVGSAPEAIEYPAPTTTKFNPPTLMPGSTGGGSPMPLPLQPPRPAANAANARYRRAPNRSNVSPLATSSARDGGCRRAFKLVRRSGITPSRIHGRTPHRTRTSWPGCASPSCRPRERAVPART